MAPSIEPRPSPLAHRASEILQLAALAVAVALSFLVGRAFGPARVFEPSPATGAAAASTAAVPAAQQLRDDPGLDDLLRRAAAER